MVKIPWKDIVAESKRVNLALGKTMNVWAVPVAQWFSTAFSPGHDPGDPGLSPTSGSMQGADAGLDPRTPGSRPGLKAGRHSTPEPPRHPSIIVNTTCNGKSPFQLASIKGNPLLEKSWGLKGVRPPLHLLLGN